MREAVKKVFDFFLPLISEKNDQGEFKRASLGRVAFWVTFGIAVYTWTLGVGDIQPSHMQMLYTLAAYNLFKKSGWFGNFKSGDNTVTVEQKPHVDEPAPRI